MEYSYKFRLYPNPTQSNLINRTLGCCRFVFNHYLAMRKEVYEQSGKTMNYYACSKDLTALKHQEETSWLRDADATALQSSLRDLDMAYQHFFRRVKAGEKPGYPRFKRKHDRRQSYKCKMNIKVLDGAVQLPKLGAVKCRISKQVRGRILSATVSRNPAGQYFVALCCTDVEVEPLEKTGLSAGVDLGIHDFAVTSEGMAYPNPKYLAKSEKKLARLQRQLSRKQKGSKNRDKPRLRVARLHEHISNQRKDMLHKTSTDLVRKYDVICLEDLAPKNMVRNHKLAKSISDARTKDALAATQVWQTSLIPSATWTAMLDELMPDQSVGGVKRTAVEQLGLYFLSNLLHLIPDKGPIYHEVVKSKTPGTWIREQGILNQPIHVQSGRVYFFDADGVYKAAPVPANQRLDKLWNHPGLHNPDLAALGPALYRGYDPRCRDGYAGGGADGNGRPVLQLQGSLYRTAIPGDACVHLYGSVDKPVNLMRALRFYIEKTFKTPVVLEHGELNV